ncbi:hypothetical protein LIP_3416 [Limnochorda pilosa]|uniref:NADH dehydrogenase n=1 Tax=Limnochorda pilosa TaxID=1555112 RepID=A0A0K2SQ28_LIMPI|nr:hypothetical protein LIP_3416 [Limnochorda pilosa]
MEAYLQKHLPHLVAAEVQKAFRQDPAARTCRIIASKGTMDWAYPPFILGSAAAAMGMDTAIFFTFYGLNLLKKDLKVQVDPIGNPAMPMPVPNAIAALPGMRAVATRMMSGMFRSKGVASVGELRQVCIESGVRLIACQMTMDALSIPREALIDGVEVAGAAGFLHEASRAHVTLFV